MSLPTAKRPRLGVTPLVSNIRTSFDSCRSATEEDKGPIRRKTPWPDSAYPVSSEEVDESDGTSRLQDLAYVYGGSSSDLLRDIARYLHDQTDSDWCLVDRKTLCDLESTATSGSKKTEQVERDESGVRGDGREPVTYGSAQAPAWLLTIMALSAVAQTARDRESSWIASDRPDALTNLSQSLWQRLQSDPDLINFLVSLGWKYALCPGGDDDLTDSIDDIISTFQQWSTALSSRDSTRVGTVSTILGTVGPVPSSLETWLLEPASSLHPQLVGREAYSSLTVQVLLAKQTQILLADTAVAGRRSSAGPKAAIASHLTHAPFIYPRPVVCTVLSDGKVCRIDLEDPTLSKRLTADLWLRLAPAFGCGSIVNHTVNARQWLPRSILCAICIDVRELDDRSIDSRWAILIMALKSRVATLYHFPQPIGTVAAGPPLGTCARRICEWVELTLPEMFIPSDQSTRPWRTAVADLGRALQVPSTTAVPAFDSGPLAIEAINLICRIPHGPQYSNMLFGSPRRTFSVHYCSALRRRQFALVTRDRHVGERLLSLLSSGKLWETWRP